jgi:hypothetical protein
MRSPSSPPSVPSGENFTGRIGKDLGEHSLANRMYRRAIERGLSAAWHIFHATGDILFTADRAKGSDNIRRLQALRRANECLSRGRTPRFSHVLMCVMPGLYIESTPSSWRIDDDSPAVRFIRAEDCDWTDRTDFLVMRPRILSSEQEFCVKTQQRCIFHGGKPYHYYFVGDQKDRVFCSELVTTIYAEAGTRLVPSRELRQTFPFDLELAFGDSADWIDVTELYARAEDLHSRKLIERETLDLRDMFLERYQVTSEIAVSLAEFGESADKVVSDYRDQMSRPVRLPPDWKHQTYVANISELFSLLKRDFPLYAQFRRFEFPGEPPERMRYNGIESADLLKKLNAVEATRTEAAKATIGVILSDYKSECRRALDAAITAKQTLGDEMTEQDRAERNQKLSILISDLDIREPASERGAGLALVDELAEWVRMAESIEVSPDADREIVKAFALCGRALHLMTSLIRLPFYGTEFFNLVQAVAEASAEDAEMQKAVATMRKALRDDLQERCVMFERLIAMRPGGERS